MVRAINPDAVRAYVLECDRELPEAEQTRFFLRTPTARIRPHLVGYATRMIAVLRSGDEKRGRELGAASNDVLRWGLVGWENLTDGETGEQVECVCEMAVVLGQRVKAPTAESIERLSNAWITELLNELTNDLQLPGIEGNG